MWKDPQYNLSAISEIGKLCLQKMRDYKMLQLSLVSYRLIILKIGFINLSLRNSTVKVIKFVIKIVVFTSRKRNI